MTESFGSTLGRVFGPYMLGTFAALLLLSLVLALIIVGILAATRTADRETLPRLFTLLIALALFGAVAGYAGGLSREAAVGQIIPAVLALAGGLAAYLFGIDTSRGAVASIALGAFTAALFFGYGFGADVRADNDINEEFRAACFKLFYDPATYKDGPTMSLALGPNNQRYKECIGYWSAIP